MQKTTNSIATEPYQLDLVFETETIRHLDPVQKQTVLTTLISLLLEASGLSEGQDDEGD